MSHCRCHKGNYPLCFTMSTAFCVACLVNQQSKDFTAFCLPNYFMCFMVDILYGMCVLFYFIASIKRTGWGVSLIPFFPFFCEYYRHSASLILALLICILILKETCLKEFAWVHDTMVVVWKRTKVIFQFLVVFQLSILNW